jgi:hypothetical protein
MAALNNRESVVKLLLADARLDPNMTNRYGGTTALIIAARYGHVPVVTLLLADERVDPNIANEDGDTALILSVFKGRDSVVKLLLADERVDPNITNENGDTVLSHRPTRPALLAWAQGLVATHHTFLHVVLRGSVIMPRHRTSPLQRCHLPLLSRSDLRRVGSFLGVEKGRRLRNVREFAAALGGSTSSTPGL